MPQRFSEDLQRSSYRLLGLIGQGQFGRVYCASHRKTGHLVALKELDRQRFPTHKFLRELRFLLSLRHLNIVSCYALEHTSTGRYLVMGYCEGGTLRNLMTEDVSLHPVQALKLIADLLSGLTHAHDRGIIHCDIKPENILLTLQHSGWTAHISDFGIAHLSQELVKESGGNTGSPAYMAPERFYGQYSYASDLYAVGVLLFELLVGQRPFSGTPYQLMSAHLNQPIKIPASVPDSLQRILCKALQKLPARRFRSAVEMLKAVQTAAAELSSHGDMPPLDRLLQPTLELPCCPYQGVADEELQVEVRQLIGVTRIPESSRSPLSQHLSLREQAQSVYRVFNNYISYQIDATATLASQPSLSEAAGLSTYTVQLPAAIQELLVSPKGCFAVTHQAIYQVLEPELAGDRPAFQPDALPLMTTFTSDFKTALEARGQWLAVMILSPNQLQRQLRIWRLPQRQVTDVTMTRLPATHLTQLLALDSRYLAAFSHRSDPETAHISGTLLEVFTRRGNLVGSLNLSVPLQQITLGSTPYRLLATEPEHSHSILFLDLKPLRMLRIGISIVPHLIASASWGYVLVSSRGEIELLSQQGEPIGRVQGPPNPTAIALLDPYRLLLSTWWNGQGGLHTIDLQQMNLEIVF